MQRRIIYKFALIIGVIISILISGYISRIYSRVESCMITLILVNDLHKNKTNILKYDARIDTIYNSNKYVIQSCRAQFGGEIIYRIVKLSNMARSRLFAKFESECFDK